MDTSLFTLLAINLVAIGALPWVFFRPGARFNTRWWLTAGPFLLAAAGLALAMTGHGPAWGPSLDVWPIAQVLFATALGAASLFLIALTLGCHRRRLACWHQADDRPDHLVTGGPYGVIRHPFYTAFLLTLLAVFLAAPQPLTLLALTCGGLALNWTAAGEERRFLASPLAAAYRKYMGRSGRFLPRLGGGAA